MAKVTTRHSRLPRASSILMMLLGIVTYFVVDHLTGAILTAVGVLMFVVYRRLSTPRQAGSAPAAENGAAS